MQFRNFSKSVCLAVFLPSTSLKGKVSVAWLLWGFQHYLRVFHSCFSPLMVVRSRRQEVPVPSLTSICNLSQKIPFATPFTWTQSNTSLCSHLFLFLWRKTSKIGYIHLHCCSCRENLSPAALGDQEPTANGALVSCLETSTQAKASQTEILQTQKPLGSFWPAKSGVFQDQIVKKRVEKIFQHTED